MTVMLMLTGLCRPGDAFFIRFFRDAELTDTFYVERDTSVYLPLAGRVCLAGLDKQEAGNRLQAALDTFYAGPRVRVYPLTRVSVVGQVERAGSYLLLPQEGFLELLARAGVREGADPARAKILRNGRALGVDLTSPDVPEAPQDGDVLVVPKSPWPSLANVYYLVSSAVLVWTVYTSATR